MRALKEELPELGRRVAIDSSNIRTHARPPAKLKEKKGETLPAEDKPKQADTKLASPRPHPLRGYPDPEASWSVKTKTEEVGGQKKQRTEASFGYKVHACVDQEHAAVLAVRTTTGAHADVREAPELLAHAAQLLGEDVIEQAAMDKAYDDGDLVKECAEEGIAAVVPVRDVPEELQEQSSEDREIAPLVRGTTSSMTATAARWPVMTSPARIRFDARWPTQALRRIAPRTSSAARRSLVDSRAATGTNVVAAPRGSSAGRCASP